MFVHLGSDTKDEMYGTNVLALIREETRVVSLAAVPQEQELELVRRRRSVVA